MTTMVIKCFPAVATKQVSTVMGTVRIEPSAGGSEIIFKPQTKGHGLKVRCQIDRQDALAALAQGNIVQVPAVAVKTTGYLRGTLVLEAVGNGHTSVRMEVEGKGHNTSLVVQAPPSEFLGGTSSAVQAPPSEFLGE